MSHPIGEHLRCDACGAEIQFDRACSCPAHDPKVHANRCCGQEMRSLGVKREGDTGMPPTRASA